MKARATMAERNGLLRLMVPRLFDEPGTILYVGAHLGGFAASLPLWKAGNELTVLEIWQPFVDELQSNSRFDERISYYVFGDVRELDELELPYTTFDYSLWLHGPEHIAFRDFTPTVQKLEDVTKKIVVMACPWGRGPHGVAKNNPHTKHLQFVYPEDFQRMDYNVAALGPKGRLGGHLLAWRELNK